MINNAEDIKITPWRPSEEPAWRYWSSGLPESIAFGIKPLPVKKSL